MSKKPNVQDPNFYSDAYTAIIKAGKQKKASYTSDYCKYCIEEYGELSRRLDRSEVQESVSVRNVLRARYLATALIEESGELNMETLDEIILVFKENLYSLGPNQQYDSVRHEHMLNALITIRDNKDIQQQIRRASKPYSNKNADQLIRETLSLPSNTAVTDTHAKRAVLSALFCYLRQNVGSCFATAPAIIIHDAQIHAFLDDIDELLGTGRLKRTFGGIEYSAPLSPSWGAGDLKKPIVVPREEKYGISNLWLSPGLVEALEAVHILDSKEVPKKKALHLKELLDELFMNWEGHQSYLLVSAEEILKRILMNHLGLTKQDLDDYANRPREILQGSLLVQVPQSAAGSGGKGELCARFYVLMEQASIAFRQLADNPLLKAWEYTVASFAETKGTFSRWNLYASLGLQQDDKDGIGPTIYKAVKGQLDILNAMVQEYHEDYERLYNQVRHLETRIRHASESEGQWLRAELQSQVNEMQSVLQMRDETSAKAQNMSGLYALLVEIYEALFPKYFQEVYDADIHEVNVGPYDDSPAGFHLIYKFGRSNTSQWLAINSPNEFIDSLVSFFVATEVEISASPHFEQLKDIFSRIVSSIIAHVRTAEFLESALRRMAAAHNAPLPHNPLENLDKVQKKPWVYTSGGSMEALVSCYFGLPQAPANTTRWVENTIELLVYLLDTYKQLPAKDLAAIARSKKPALLMHSPTHAFLFTPMCKKFQELASSEAFTYTWVRDHFVIPSQRFVANIVLDEAKMAYLVSLLAEKVPIQHRLQFRDSFSRLYGTMSPIEFREHILEGMKYNSGLSLQGRSVLSPEEIDSFLYSHVPLISIEQLRGCVESILNLLPGVEKNVIPTILKSLDDFTQPFGEYRVVSAIELQNIVKGLLCYHFERTSTPIDYHKAVACAAQQLQFTMPSPIIFADTNWVKDYFAFTVNPGTGNFELWRVDPTGMVGAPMSAWSHWLDGTQRHPTWGVYIRPHEYLNR